MTKKWWHEKVAYQIYPKSFMDTNGDGIGDLRGIISKLDYLKDLGVDIVWLSPIYKSPFVDQGYDISDYYSIAEEFGTMEEFDELLAEAKKRDMHIVMDLVVNHCSDKHEWFLKAIENPDGEYGDYFYIREGKDGKEPSNYRAYFGGNAWEKVPGTENKYYLHMFCKEQPDLNWENTKVREEIYKMINWWLDKGLAGFRIDAIINIKKDLNFPNYEPDGPDGLVSCTAMVDNVDGVGEFLQELKHETFDKYDAFTVGEVFNMKEDELEEFVGEEGHFSTMFDFGPHILTYGDHGWYDGKKIEFASWRDTIFRSQERTQGIGFLANIIENHDEPRGVCRYLPEHARDDKGKKMLATTSVLLRGLPFLFQGQEIGMENCVMNDVSEYNDVNTLDQYQMALNAGCSVEEAMACCYENSRDNARTPMQWSDAVNAGFSTGTPWMKVNPNYTRINVASQENDDDSVLAYYKELIALRKAEEYRQTFTYGIFKAMYEEEDNVFAFLRTNEETGQRILVAANFGTEPVSLQLPKEAGKVLLSNVKDTDLTVKSEVNLDSSDVVVILL